MNMDTYRYLNQDPNRLNSQQKLSTEQTYVNQGIANDYVPENDNSGLNYINTINHGEKKIENKETAHFEISLNSL